MKLKLETGLVSCRLSLLEAQSLASGKTIEDSVDFPDGARFAISASIIDILTEPHFSFHPDSNTFAFALNDGDARRLASMPMKEGLGGDFHGGKFSIMVDVKDFATKSQKGQTSTP